MKKDDASQVELESFHTSSSEGDDERVVNTSEKIALYSRSTARSTSRGLVRPFVNMIALNLGASAGLLGWIISISNLLSTLLNPLFGRLSDIVRRRIPFIVFSTITWLLPYAFLFWVNNPWQIVAIVAIVNLLMSLGEPSWVALQNELFPKQVRAKLTGRVFWFDAFGSMVATIFTGIILTFVFDDLNYQQYILIPVALGFVISIIGVIPFSRIKEPLKKMIGDKQPASRNIGESFRKATKNKPFVKFLLFSTIYSFFLTFPRPLFSIKQVTILEATAIQVAILSVIFSLSTIFVIIYGAKLSDKFGRTKLIFFNRMTLVLFPLTYIFAQKIWHLYLIHLIVAPLMTIGTASDRAYLLNLVPSKEGGMYFGLFNMITGIFLFLGSLVGGYMVELFEIWYSQETAVTITFLVVSVGRIIAALPFLSLKEVKKFPSSFGVIMNSFKEKRRNNDY